MRNNGSRQNVNEAWNFYQVLREDATCSRNRATRQGLGS
jgi:hypothetical protein